MKCIEPIQSLAVANKASFRNCLVSMRPKSITKDIPSTHNVATYIHNQFVERLKELKGDILVSWSIRYEQQKLTKKTGSAGKNLEHC